jgi:hypothetical protein
LLFPFFVPFCSSSSKHLSHRQWKKYCSDNEDLLALKGRDVEMYEIVISVPDGTELEVVSQITKVRGRPRSINVVGNGGILVGEAGVFRLLMEWVVRKFG